MASRGKRKIIRNKQTQGANPGESASSCLTLAKYDVPLH